MEGVETPSAASVVAVIMATLWTLMRGTVLVSSAETINRSDESDSMIYFISHISSKNVKHLLVQLLVFFPFLNFQTYCLQTSSVYVCMKSLILRFVTNYKQKQWKLQFRSFPYHMISAKIKSDLSSFAIFFFRFAAFKINKRLSDISSSVERCHLWLWKLVLDIFHYFLIAIS